MVWWVLLVPWLLLPHWAALADRRFPGWRERRSVPSFRKTILACGLLVPVLYFLTPVSWLLGATLPPPERYLAPATPWQLAQTLQGQPPTAEWQKQVQARLRGGRLRGSIFATETMGEYLLWALPANMPVLACTHVHLLPPDHWTNCRVVKWGRPGWQQFLDWNRVELIVVEPEMHPKLCQALHESEVWQVVVDGTGADPRKGDHRPRQLIALRRPVKR
jgi:hypothetical protein